MVIAIAHKNNIIHDAKVVDCKGNDSLGEPIIFIKEKRWTSPRIGVTL
jgi:hypothetical protein